MTGLRYLANVVSLQLNQSKCTGCGMCAMVCPHAVFMIEQQRAQIVDRDACMECGACARNCPSDAISVEAGVGCAVAIVKGVIGGAQSGCGCGNKPSCCG